MRDLTKRDRNSLLRRILEAILSSDVSVVDGWRSGIPDRELVPVLLSAR